MSPHFPSDRDPLTMGSLVILLITVTLCGNGVYCDTFPTTTVASPDDSGQGLEANGSHAFDTGSIWESLGVRRRNSSSVTRLNESKTAEVANRKSRFLGSLAFLAGLNFGGLAGAASSTVKNTVKSPASFSLDPSKNLPYFAAYYSPYSLLPYSLFYPGSLGLVPMTDHAKPQTTSHDDLRPQVISVFDDRESADLADEEYVDGDKSIKRTNVKNGAVGHAAESRGEADRNAEEKTMTRGCQQAQAWKHGGRGSARDREDFQMNEATLDFRAANMTDNPNQTNTTMPETPLTPNTTDSYYYYGYNSTTPPSFPGYYSGHPQNVNHVDLTSDSYNYGSINYNLPYEQPANFYRNDKYNVYSGAYTNEHFSGPFSVDQANEYVSPDFDRYHPEYHQPPYANGFRPVK